jgi:hypothetical protein
LHNRTPARELIIAAALDAAEEAVRIVAQTGQCIKDQRKAVGEVIAGRL